MVTKNELRHELLDSIIDGVEAPKSFSACLNAHGLYNSMQFVLRLSPVVHELVNQVTSESNPRYDWESLQAYSTYIHETVHWWQHVGSTTGFVVSMCYPSQSHVNHTHLINLINAGVKRKSIKSWAGEQESSILNADSKSAKDANFVVNNAMDVEFFKAFVLRPKLAAEISQNPYFESVGHSFHMAYAQVINTLSATCDRSMEWLPDARRWENEFTALRNERRRGYYYGTPIAVPPLGLLEILEGQARFIQLQFLSCAAARHFLMSELEEMGFLNGVYAKAFDVFLALTMNFRPESMDDQIVSLFLLICDLAINPLPGFPIDIANFETFIEDVDPGIRFANLCLAAKSLPEISSTIRLHSRDEYDHVAGVLTSACGYDHPFRGLEVISSWAQTSRGVIEIMSEKETFRYQHGNLPVRVLFSHFIGFSIDKLSRPDFFCWAGAKMADHRGVDTDDRPLWLSHLSLFADKADDDGIFPRILPGKDPAAVQETFDVFYSNNALYDLTRQWIIQDGPFHYDYSWLSRAHSDEDLAQWAKVRFKNLYGINPDDLELV